MIHRGSEGPVVERPVSTTAPCRPCSLAAAEATEEAIVDSLFTATTIEGFRGVAPALPVDKVLELAGVSTVDGPD